LSMALLTMGINRSGLVIALGFVSVVLATSILSRYLRSTELRFQGFQFVDEAARAAWDRIRQLEFQVLVPHRPGLMSLEDKNREVRRKHRLPPDVPIIFISAELGDPSEFDHS